LSPEEQQKIVDSQNKFRTWKDSVLVLTLALEHVAQLAAGGDDSTLRQRLCVRFQE
jgi:hypothetical protein